MCKNRHSLVVEGRCLLEVLVDDWDFAEGSFESVDMIVIRDLM